MSVDSGNIIGLPGEATAKADLESVKFIFPFDDNEASGTTSSFFSREYQENTPGGVLVSYFVKMFIPKTQGNGSYTNDITISFEGKDGYDEKTLDFDQFESFEPTLLTVQGVMKPILPPPPAPAEAIVRFSIDDGISVIEGPGIFEYQLFWKAN